MTDRAGPGAPPVAIRRPRPEDADQIASVHVATWKEAYANLLPEGFFTEDHARMRREMWTRILSDPREEWTIRVAEFDGEIIGFAMAGLVQEAAESPARPSPSRSPAPPTPPARELYTLYVLRSHHGGGTGQALLDATIGAGTESESESESEPESASVSLWVAKQNPRAIAFYLRNGFRFDGTEKQDPGAPAITDARMVRL
ncbi:N-acetyltransferase family protein [Nesterenkonia sp. CF4.4]|uniref:GNAT family N-acetyltransferase n=1 Tax=Nesterenkonia sp. CF4.4 TaxID=3373079 RepID=UPI003EE46E55